MVVVILLVTLNFFLSAVINFLKIPSRITFENLGTFNDEKGKYM